ncbi:hypothetical protein [Actinophytocola xanthii]|uniref:Uncharacterized protein n=1 Tax=Actinophytocola xanthii TaxID=1912961 RepID=A0A1Q8CMQ4_9PSEU|nr:hypothetical protein [Actinophytocola xanthii]OLF15625.1 hypothetical protein BU204_21170 [Actinophytocola xanthii]
MTGQGGIHEGRARFAAEVESALTRARRAASEAKAQSGEFRRGTEELADQARTGRLRGVHRGQVEPTGESARAEAEKFREANGLHVERYPGADALIARLPAEPRPAPPVEDEDFSQHEILVDADAPDEPDAADEPAQSVPHEVARRVPADPPTGDDEDFSQQRILFDVAAESYRPESLQPGPFGYPDEQNPR